MSQRSASELWPRALRALGRHFLFILTVLLAVVFIAPLFWMVSSSGKSLAETYSYPVVWWPTHFLFSNYPNSFQTFPYFSDALNTLRIAVPAVLGSVVSSALVAYGFACLEWRGQNVVFYCVLATLMVPTWVTVVPLFILFNKIGWVNTFYPLWVPAWFGDPFSIFLLRQFFRNIPKELLAAARVDGASQWRVFRSVVIPLSYPALAVVALFGLIYTWTDFLLPLVYLTNPKLSTLQLGLADFFGKNYVIWPQFMAGAVLVALPVVLVFLATQRSFIEGIATTGLRR
jgi:multiple sugar transport system permease protein